MSGYRRSFPKGTSERMCALMSEARNISELKRAQCIYFRSEHGLPPQQIADMVGFDVGTVRNLHSAFLRDGEAAAQTVGQPTAQSRGPSSQLVYRRRDRGHAAGLSGYRMQKIPT